MDLPHHTELTRTDWDIIGVADDDRLIVGVEGDVRPATISFLADGAVAGSTGCNRFMGSGELAPGAVAFGPLATTMMMCPDPAMVQERRILAALGSAATWSIVDDVLRLADRDGATVLEAHRRPPG
jgi:heat shock protein HslJ